MAVTGSLAVMKIFVVCPTTESDGRERADGHGLPGIAHRVQHALLELDAVRDVAGGDDHVLRLAHGRAPRLAGNRVEAEVAHHGGRQTQDDGQPHECLSLVRSHVIVPSFLGARATALQSSRCGDEGWWREKWSSHG